MNICSTICSQFNVVVAVEGKKLFGIAAPVDATAELMDEQNTPIPPEDFDELISRYCAQNLFTIKLNLKVNNEVAIITSEVSFRFFYS